MRYSKRKQRLSNQQFTEESIKIAQCLAKAVPIALSLLEKAFEDNDIRFKLIGEKLDMQFELSKGKYSMSMFLRNLFLEIATVDRDAEPLRYDYQLDDPKFLLKRIFDIVASKLAIILPLLNGKDVKEVEKLSDNYERMRIALLDGENLDDEIVEKIKKGEFPMWR